MGASASVADRQLCPAITDMRAHEVAAHTSILKALRRDYSGTQSLLRRCLARFEGSGGAEVQGANKSKRRKNQKELPADTPHYQRCTLSTEKRGFFPDMDHITFLSEREKMEKGMGSSKHVRPEIQAVMDEVVKCFEESPQRCIALLHFFIQTSVQPETGDYVFLPLSPGRGIARVKMIDLSGAREEGLHFQIVFADGFTNWVSLAELKMLPPLSDLEPLQQLAMLHVACFDGDIDTVDELIHYEIDPTAPDERGTTAVQIAAEADRGEILELFVANGYPADIKEQIVAAKEAVLHSAASECNVHMCKKLLQQKIQPHKRQADGLTAVHHAVQGGYMSIIRMFRVYAPHCVDVLRQASQDESAHATTHDLLALHGDYIVPTEELLNATNLVCAGSGQLAPKPLLVLQVERKAEPVPLLVLSSDYQLVKRELESDSPSQSFERLNLTMASALGARTVSSSSDAPDDKEASGPSRESRGQVQHGLSFTATFVGCDGTFASFPDLILWEPSTKKKRNTSTANTPSGSKRPRHFSSHSSLRSMRNLLFEDDQDQDIETSYAALLAGSARCHSHVHSREYFLEAMEVCLRENGKRKPSAVSFDACMVLLRAAAGIRDQRMYDVVADWMSFKWPDREAETKAVKLLGEEEATRLGVPSSFGDAKSEAVSASNQGSADAAIATDNQDLPPSGQENGEPETPFCRTEIWRKLRAFIKEHNEVPDPLSLKTFAGVSFDQAQRSLKEWKKVVARFHRRISTAKSRPHTGTPVLIETKSRAVSPSHRGVPAPADCLVAMVAAEQHQVVLDDRAKEAAFKATPLGQMLEESRQDRLRHLSKAEAQAEGRRLMEAKTKGADAPASPKDWISPERASALALEVMLHDDSATNQKKEVPLCTHGKGPPVFGQYMGVDHE